MSYGNDEPSEAYDPEPSGVMRRDRDRQSIEQRLDRLGKHLAMLAEQVDRAEGVLGPILRPPRPTPALAGGGSREEDSSVLADRVEGASQEAYALGRRLDGLLDRVDL